MFGCQNIITWDTDKGHPSMSSVLFTSVTTTAEVTKTFLIISLTACQ